MLGITTQAPGAVDALAYVYLRVASKEDYVFLGIWFDESRPRIPFEMWKVFLITIVVMFSFPTWNTCFGIEGFASALIYRLPFK